MLKIYGRTEKINKEELLKLIYEIEKEKIIHS